MRSMRAGRRRRRRSYRGGYSKRGVRTSRGGIKIR